MSTSVKSSKMITEDPHAAVVSALPELVRRLQDLDEWEKRRREKAISPKPPLKRQLGKAFAGDHIDDKTKWKAFNKIEAKLNRQERKRLAQEKAQIYTENNNKPINAERESSPICNCDKMSTRTFKNGHCGVYYG